MLQHQFTALYTEFEKLDDLAPADKLLMEEAISAAKSAYAPYSGFFVGAAVLLENGAVVCGNNQENAAYPSGMCGERVAMFSASAQFPGIAFKAIAIYACSDKISVNEAVTPCGSCRQVMAEYHSAFENPFRILLKGEKSSILVFDGIESLLPLMFLSKHLKS